MKAKHWYDSLWVYAIIYFALGFFNILFAWLGMIDFLLPLFLAIFGGNKFFCNHLCGRGQLFSKLGTDLKCSRCIRNAMHHFCVQYTTFQTSMAYQFIKKS